MPAIAPVPMMPTAHYLVVAGPHPRDLCLATVGRSAVVATLICLVQGLRWLSQLLHRCQFLRRPGARAAGGCGAHLLHCRGIDRRGRLSPRAADVGEDGSDLPSFSVSPCAGMRPTGPSLPCSSTRIGTPGAPIDVRRAGDVRRRARLLASVGAMAAFAEVLVDFLSGCESLLIGRAQRRPLRAPCLAFPAIRCAPSPCGAIAELAFFARPRRSARARAASVTNGPPARAGGAGGSAPSSAPGNARAPPGPPRPPGTGLARRIRIPGAPARRSLASSHRAAPLRRRAKAPNRCQAARDVLRHALQQRLDRRIIARAHDRRGEHRDRRRSLRRLGRPLQQPVEHRQLAAAQRR